MNKGVFFVVIAVFAFTLCSFASDSLNIHRVVRQTLDRTDDIFLYGNYALVSGSGNIKLIDISNPLAPFEASRCYAGTDGNENNGVLAFERFAYMVGNSCTSPSYFAIFDIVNPLSPTLIISEYLDYTAWGLSADFPYACISGGSGGHAIYDVSFPSAPSEISSLSPYAYKADIRLPYIYAAVSGGDFNIYDLSSIPTGTLVSHTGHTTLGDYIYNVTVDGDFVYATGGSHFTVIDVSMPSAPVAVGSYAYAGGILGKVAVKYPYAFVACNGGPFRVFDISIPSSPTPVGFYDNSCYHTGVDVRGDYAYVIGVDCKFTVYDISSCLSSIEEIPTPQSFGLSAFPNPFNSAVKISVESPVGEGLRPARVEVFDLAGRHVAQLPSPSVPLPVGEGGNSFSLWDKVSEGRMRAEFTWQPEKSIGSGVYLVRVRVGVESVSKRIVYLK